MLINRCTDVSWVGYLGRTLNILYYLISTIPGLDIVKVIGCADSLILNKDPEEMGKYHLVSVFE